MSFKIALRIFSGVAGLSVLTACQAVFPGEEDTSIGAQRLSQTQAVSSRQRLDEDGYPLLGAYPGTAAPQLSDTAVAQTQSRLGGIAQARASSGSRVSYADDIARSQDARRRQAAILADAAASQPAASGTTRRGPRPEDVLRQIEATETSTN